MKTFRLIFFGLFALLISACQAEIWEPAGENIITPSDGPIITISTKALSAINTSETKAVCTDPEINAILSTINDLNIRVDLSDKTSLYIFCKGDQISISNPNQTAEFITNNLTSKGDNIVQIHLAKLKSPITFIEVIANYGKSLDGIKDWSGIKETGTLDLAVKDYCMMYGSTKTATDKPLPGHTECKNYNVQLKRSRAMISVSIINKKIAKGLTITPKFLRFYNMPNECNITSLGTDTGNKIINTNQVAPVCEFPVSEGSLIGTGKAPTKPEHIGNHADVKPINTKFFVFPLENKQGIQPNASNEDRTKYPKEVLAFPEKERVSAAKDQANVFKYTYLEIEAEYAYRNDKSPVGGTILYRLFLGGNVKDNFNIVGNYYYKVNLSLSEFAGAAEDGKVSGGTVVANDADNSWRVDMDVKDWGFQKSQYDFDSHYYDAYIDVVGTGWTFTDCISGDPYSSWLTINIKDKGDGMGEWINPTRIAKDGYELKIIDGKLRFNMQPMVYGKPTFYTPLDPAGYFDETTYNKPVNYRQMIITVTNADGSDSKDVTVRQYAPIPVIAGGETVFMERFEEYENNIIGYPWKYVGDDLSKYKYSYDDYKKDDVGLNAKKLKQAGSAVAVCFEKSKAGIQQGAGVMYYALPNETMMRAMFTKASTYDESWGPFEQLNIYDDYWTSTVPKAAKTQTIYYNGYTKDYTLTKDQERDLPKRVRSVYTVNSKY